jgi:hypothetical protein
MRALEAAEKLSFVSGHDFSRAVNDYIRRALAPEVRLSNCLRRTQLQREMTSPHMSEKLTSG